MKAITESNIAICVTDIYFKYEWVAPLKDKKSLLQLQCFSRNLRLFWRKTKQNMGR